MRAWIFSDLHRDVVPWEPKALPEADVALVAGDVGEGVEASLEWLARAVRPRMRTVFVAGNHEFYRGTHPDELARGRSLAARLGIDFLEDEAVWTGDVAVAGCTLWTDYALDGESRVGAAMAAAGSGMTDHRLIARTSRSCPEPFRPEDAAAVHRASRARLETLALMPAWRLARARIVVTHHAPAAASLDPRFAGSRLNAAFGSRLEPLIGRLDADLWVHGHVHAGRDHVVGRTRVLCNPRGYGRENPGFDPALVVEVPDRIAP